MNVGELKRQLEKVPDVYEVGLEEPGRVFLTVEPNMVFLSTATDNSGPTQKTETIDTLPVI